MFPNQQIFLLLKEKFHLKNEMSHYSFLSRNNVIIRDGINCMYCNTELSLNDMTIDHIIPRSKGGSNTLVNLTISCTSCNTERGNLHIEEWCKRKRLSKSKFLKLKKLYEASLKSCILVQVMKTLEYKICINDKQNHTIYNIILQAMAKLHLHSRNFTFEHLSNLSSLDLNKEFKPNVLIKDCNKMIEKINDSHIIFNDELK